MLHSLTSNSFLVPVLLCIIQSFCCCCFISVLQLFDLKSMFHWGHVHLSTYKIFFLEQQFIHYIVFSSVVSVEVVIYWECFILATCYLFLSTPRHSPLLDEDDCIFFILYLCAGPYLIPYLCSGPYMFLYLFPTNLSNFMLNSLIFCLQNFLWQMDTNSYV